MSAVGKAGFAGVGPEVEAETPVFELGIVLLALVSVFAGFVSALPAS